MRVLHVHNFYQLPGGEDQCFASTGAMLKEHGHEVVPFTLDNDAVATVGKVATATTAVWNSTTYRELRRLIHTTRPDVAHFENTFPLVSQGFVASLANVSVFDRMLADGALIRVPLEQPLVNISSRIQGHIAGEGAAKPISRITLSQGGLARSKASSIIVVSEELARDMSGAASALIARELRKGVAGATDQQFLTTITSGITPIAATGDIYTDLTAMLGAMELDASSRLYMICDPATVKRLAARGSSIAGFEFPDLKLNPLGGSIAGMPVLPSDQVPVIGSPGTGIVLVDASQIAGDSNIVSLDRATQASLQMDDAPTQASGGTGSPEMSGGSTMVSLFQTNSVALRAERYFGAQRLRTAAVQILSGATW